MYTLSIKQFCLIALFSCPFLLFAQDFNNYQPLVSEAPIPEEFILSSTQKYERDKQTINRQDKRSKRKAQGEFYLENNFVLDEMLLSGSVLFNDPISKYVEKVADELLKNDQELRSKLRFYTIKSVVPNAFATDRGTIFITLGLMARLNNEAELAYILSHEIVHFAKKHSLNSYVKFEIENTSTWQQESRYKKLVERNNYSKELEMEADEVGFDYFEDSKYSYKAIAKVFDVLALAHTPYGNIPFEKEYLETTHFKITKDYLLESVKPLEKMDDDSETSTHPALSERKDKLQIKIAKKTDEGRSAYLVSSAEFEKVKTTAKFEICQTLLQESSYQDAIYCSFLLSKEYPNNDFLQRTLVYSLYALAQYKNDKTSNTEALKKIEFSADEHTQGELLQVYHIVALLSGKDLAVLAALHAWEYYKKYPDNVMFKKIAVDMVEDLVIYQIEDPQDYFSTDAENKDTTITDLSFYAFADWMGDKELLSLFEQGKKYKENIEKRKAFNKTKEGKKARKKRNKQILLKGEALGLEKAVFLNPIYYKMTYNYYSKGKLLLLESEKRQERYKAIIEEGGKAAGLETKVLDMNGLDNSTPIEEYQDLIVLNNWMSEMLEHDGIIVGSNYDRVVPLIEKYGTAAFVYTGTLTTHFLSDGMNSYAKLATSAMFIIPPLTPLSINYLLSQKHRSLYFTLVFDAEQHRSIMTYSNMMKTKDKNALIKLNLFWTLQQMSNEKPSK